MTVWMILFLAVGAVFGWVTFPHRHLFGEGPAARDASAAGDGARLSWVLVCSALWPLLACTGAYSVWLLARRRKTAELPPGK